MEALWFQGGGSPYYCWTRVGSSLLLVGTVPFAQERAGSHPQIAQIYADVFRVSTPLLVLRYLRLVTQSGQSFA